MKSDNIINKIYIKISVKNNNTYQTSFEKIFSLSIYVSSIFSGCTRLNHTTVFIVIIRVLSD